MWVSNIEKLKTFFGIDILLLFLLLIIIARGLRMISINIDKTLAKFSVVLRVDRRSRSPSKEWNGREKRERRDCLFPKYVTKKVYRPCLAGFCVVCFFVGAFIPFDPLKNQ